MARTVSGNYDALAWVQDEVQQSLADALQALTRYIDDPTNTASLETCITQLHQVNGTVEMLNLNGAHLLASEMLTSAITLRDQQSSEQSETQDALLKSLLLLPNYLQVIGIELEDHPLRIITTINELRLARGDNETLLSSVFNPTLSIHLPEFITPDPSKPKPTIKISLKKISHVFQISLLDWFKSNDQTALYRMADILHYLRLSSMQERSVILWWAAEGVIEALLDGGLIVDSELKLKIGQLNKSIKIFTHEDEQHLQAIYPTALVQELLLLSAQATSNGKHTFLLKNTFNLNFFDAEQHQKIYNLSSSALADVHSELLNQLQEIKEYIDQFERHAEHSVNSIQQLPQQLESMANTFKLLADNSSSTLLQQHADSFTQLVDKRLLPEDQLLMTLANDLIEVEAKLQGSVNTGSNQSTDTLQLQNTVISECQNDLNNIKESLSILSNQSDNAPEILSNAANQLQSIANTLLMVNLNQVASLFENTAQQMNQMVTQGQAISNQELNWFADIIAFADLYMDILRQGGSSEQTQLLIDGQSTLLNFNQLPPLDADVILLHDDELAIKYSEPSEIDSIQTETKTGVERYIDMLIEQENKPESSVQRYINNLPEKSPKTSVERYIDAQAEENVPLVLSEQVSTPISNDIDPEISEIFIEEAEEVLAELQQLIPTWQQEHDLETLNIIRRHFHTLKGSGRMAGALVVGELSWSVENILNQILDGKAAISSTLDSLLHNSYIAIPPLLSLFMAGDYSTPKDIDSLIQIANSRDAQEAEAE
ncbi:MAG: Hpt domain-containing protein, partial [Gammaproteobacteria bacterium]|nr:Hpt domain-containing protein [Gammaproteobacteria bacterium]